MFQKQAKKSKQTSLQDRSLFEIAFALLCVKVERAFRSQRDFGSSSSEIHIFGYA